MFDRVSDLAQGLMSAGANFEFRSSHSWSTGGAMSEKQHKLGHRKEGLGSKTKWD